MGADQDNILVGEDGKVWRIDNGGSMRYRAQGQEKTAEWFTKYPLDLWSMRDPNMNQGAGKHNYDVFKDVDFYEIIDQARGLIENEDAILSSVDPAVRETMHGRIETMRDLVEVSDTFRKDAFVSSYTDLFSEHLIKMKHAGIIENLPKQFTRSKGSVTVEDENGRTFDNLRGKGSHVTAVADYMKKNGGNHSIITEWMQQQGRDSWNPSVQAMKWHRQLQRGDDPSRYWWKHGPLKARGYFDEYVRRAGSRAIYDKTVAMWHAFTFELLRGSDFDRNRPDRGYVEIVRTENDDVIQFYGLKQDPGLEQTFLKGGVESGSLFNTVTVFGDKLTLQRVPWHRIMGVYWQEKNPGKGGCGFLGDAENEIAFDGSGIPSYYLGKVRGGLDTGEFWNKVYEATGDKL